MRRNGPSLGSAPSSILYIGLIPFEWDEDNLKAVVCGTGNVLDVRLGFDHVGKNKGYAFVEFESPQQALHAKTVLAQVQIMHPGSRTAKRLRIELSKEGFRTGNNDNKSVIPFNPAHLPPSVQLPQEVLSKHPQLQQMLSQQMLSQQMPPQNYGNPPARAAGPTPAATPTSGTWAMPDRYVTATSTLPHVTPLPFATSDKINQTLSQIPPAQLVELIANLKNILGSSNAARAADVFQISPALAPTAAQALLLMGLIDEEVIQEALKAGAAPAATPAYVGAGGPTYGSNASYGGNGGTVPYGGSGANAPYGGNAPGFPGGAPQSKWPHLPLSTQMKLSNLPADQAELIAQVLSLPADQISALPPDRQQMVASIRQQYL